MNDDHHPDDELVRSALEARTPVPPDARDELERLRPRYLRARRRRRVAVAGSSIAASVVVLGGGAALFSLIDDGTERIETIPPAVTGDIGSSTTTEPSTTSTTVVVTTTEPTATSTPDSSTAITGPEPDPSPPTTSSAPDPTDPPTTGPDAATPSSTPPTVPETTVPLETTVPAETTTTTATAPVVEMRSNAGGSVTVELADGVARLVSAVANPGFVADIRESSGSRVDVRFEPEDSSGSPWRIRADVEGGGLVWDTD